MFHWVYFSCSYSSMTAALASSIRSFMYFFIRSFLLCGIFLWRFFCESFFLQWFSSDDMIFKKILTYVWHLITVDMNKTHREQTGLCKMCHCVYVCTCIFICYLCMYIYSLFISIWRGYPVSQGSLLSVFEGKRYMKPEEKRREFVCLCFLLVVLILQSSCFSLFSSLAS